jgi:RNA polymerase sigma-70 factor (ECF subfamily)
MSVMAVPSAGVEDFRVLYQSSWREVYWYLRNRSGDPSLAEDLTSEVYLKAVEMWHAGRSEVVTVPWLIRVARNLLIDHWRRSERERRRLRLTAGGVTDDDMPFAAEELDPEEVRRAMAQLSPDHRAALTLKYIDRCSLADTADALGRGLSATGSLLERARRALRERLQEVTHE